MKKHFLLFLLLCRSVFALAQTTDATVLIETLNERLRAVPKGMFTIEGRFKFADGEDTTLSRGVCYFFRESNPDSVAKFVILEDHKPVYAFDGSSFYQAAGPDKMWVTATQASGGLKRLIRGNVKKSDLIYENLLRVDRPNFRLASFDSVAISAVRLDGLPVLRLTVRDTSIEPMLGNVENNKIISTYHWDIVLPDYYIAQFSGDVWLFDGWQYERKRLSPITALPADARLEDYFNPEKLTGYTFEQYDPNAPAKRDKELVAKGDILPDFTLTDLKGATFAARDQKKGLLLLDFWYKGCFPCQLAMPKIESLHQKYAAKGLTVLGVNPIDQNSASLSDWLQTRKISYNTLFDPDKILPKALGITGYPLLIVADAKTKKVLFVKMGFNEDLESILEPIIVKHLK